MAVPLGSLHGVPGRSSQSHQSLLELSPSTWCAAVAVPHRKSSGNLSSLIAGQHNETTPRIQARSTRIEARLRSRSGRTGQAYLGSPGSVAGAFSTEASSACSFGNSHSSCGPGSPGPTFRLFIGVKSPPLPAKPDGAMNSPRFSSASGVFSSLIVITSILRGRNAVAHIYGTRPRRRWFNLVERPCQPDSVDRTAVSPYGSVNESRNRLISGEFASAEY